MQANHQRIMTAEMRRDGKQTQSRRRRTARRNNVKWIHDHKDDQSPLQTREKPAKA
jgi:hypothetical protein